MKILELRFKNLNSLCGEWIIDFTDPEYVSNGIFALTGPTGAGKSTILDAICLALYGTTPRLGKITQSGNEIMSRQSGECYAEVLFESQAGRFRCHWEQRRARKKADGNLQDQEHQIVDADSGKPIETKKSLVSRVIEEKTGMDFDRFTRSMLLAQGGFDTFLKADVEQKSKILEQITGTDIYSKISQHVHERRHNEREKLNLLQTETSGIVILETEQEKEIQLDLEAKLNEETKLKGKSTETNKAISWLTSIDELKKEINSLTEETVKLKSYMEAFKPERDKLDRAIKAASLDGSYATLTAIRKQQLDDQTTLKDKKTTLLELESSAKEQAESLKLTEQLSIKIKEEQKAALPLNQKVRSLDQKLAELKKAISEGEENCQKDAAKVDTEKQTRLKELEKKTEAAKNLELIDCYFKEHTQDEWLISGLAGIEEQLNNMLSKQKEISQNVTDCEKAETVLKQAIKKLDNYANQCNLRKQNLKKASKELQEGKDALSTFLDKRLLREYRTEKDTLLREMTFLSTIRKLEDHRTKLEDGKPCPLCGSEEHPFAEGNIPMPDEIEKRIAALTELITKAEDLEALNKMLEEAEAVSRKNLTDSENQEVNAANEKKILENTLAELKNGLEKHKTGYSVLNQAVSAKLKLLGHTEIPDDNVSSLLESLKDRLNRWQNQDKKKADIEKQVANIDSEIKRLDAVIGIQYNNLAEKQDRLVNHKKELASRSAERKELYGDKKPDDEDNRMNKAIIDSEEAEKKTRTQNLELQQKLITEKAHVESLKKNINQRDPELKKTEARFSMELTRAGFSEEKQFIEARLTTEQRDSLTAKTKELDDNQTNLMARQDDRKTRMTTESAKKITDKPLEELEPQFKEYEESLKDLRNAIACHTFKLNENTSAKERVKEKQTAIEAQKKECNRWEKLHALIGSKDGKKYRNFAQGLTFELMVSHANRQLEKMTDRYLLIRDNEQPLELNVIDNYQAGEIRSTKNLSGGESFIVSLTLALGLSKMASRKVRVDSLFLDEGFGTLDEEALETALEALSGLQQDSKLIGVISHVSALKERISTQITISPVSGGCSSLAGPGCRNIVK